MYQICNSSSERMTGIGNNRIDLVITSPPFNIDTEYGDYNDSYPLDTYVRVLQNVIAEVYRVLKPEGRFILEVTDTIYINGIYVQLASLIQSLCLNRGFNLENRYINFAHTKDYIEIPDDNWNPDHTTVKNACSNCLQIMVFTKIVSTPKFHEGKLFYFNYKPAQGHPCPFSYKLISVLLDMYFRSGFHVLDPFMGTARLGEQVVKRGGYFYGYEVVRRFYDTADLNLKKVLS